MNILVLDNYDSFTYNLVQYIERVHKAPVDVYRNDQIRLEDVDAYDKILISPGPGIPDEAGITIDLIRRYGPHKSILGVCLGHQAIAEAYGGKIRNLDRVYHGVVGQMTQLIEGDYLLKGIPVDFDAGVIHQNVEIAIVIVVASGEPHTHQAGIGVGFFRDFSEAPAITAGAIIAPKDVADGIDELIDREALPARREVFDKPDHAVELARRDHVAGIHRAVDEKNPQQCARRGFQEERRSSR